MQQCRELVRGLVFLLCFGIAHTLIYIYVYIYICIYIYIYILGGYNRYIQTCAELCLGGFVTTAIQNNNDDTSEERQQHYCS